MEEQAERPPSAHELKTWPQQFLEIMNRVKEFEVRRNDRDFQEGDILFLREWDPETEQYTGRNVTCHVTHFLAGDQFGIKHGFCVMGIKLVGR